MKYPRSVDGYLRKAENRKIDEKGSRHARKAKPIIVNKKKITYNLWAFDSDVENALLLLSSFISMKQEFLSFVIIVSNFEGWKGLHFYGQPWATFNLAMLLPHSMRWDIIALVWSANLIHAKKSIALLGLKIFSNCISRRLTGKILGRLNKLQFCFLNFKLLLRCFF